MKQELYNQLTDFLKRKFCRVSSIEDIVHEIVNQAYLNLLQSQKYDSSKENFGYLSKSCLHLMYQHFRRQRDNAEHIFHLNIVELSDEYNDEVVINRIFVNDLLNSLKENEKAVIYYRYYKNMSFKDISKKLNLNLNTVLSHHKRALIYLKSKFLPVLCVEEPKQGSLFSQRKTQHFNNDF